MEIGNASGRWDFGDDTHGIAASQLCCSSGISGWSLMTYELAQPGAGQDLFLTSFPARFMIRPDPIAASTARSMGALITRCMGGR